MRHAIPLLLLAWAPALPAAGEPAAPAASGLDRAHRAVVEKVRPSIVGIRARGTLGDVVGTGILIDRDGTILTSSSVVGRGADTIRVYTTGPRLLAARLVGVREEEECALIQVDPCGLPPIVMGDSDAVTVGQRVYAVGNAENALVHDDQAAFAVGLVSGLYGLREARMGSTYTGRVIETTAAVNPGIEGGALVDAEGRLVGLLILNYSPLRWLGTAIPVNSLKPVIEELRRAKPPPEAKDPGQSPAPGVIAFFGADFEPDPAEQGGLTIKSVAPEGPAEAAGLVPGDRVLEVAGKKVSKPAELVAELRKLAPGDLVWMKVDLGGAVREIKVKLGGIKP
jgi:putative serine protease PepD